MRAATMLVTVLELPAPAPANENENPEPPPLPPVDTVPEPAMDSALTFAAAVAMSVMSPGAVTTASSIAAVVVM
jgi:hypothetical protein